MELLAGALRSAFLAIFGLECAVTNAPSRTDHGASGHIKYSASGNILGIESITVLKKVVDGKIVPLDAQH